MTNNKFATVQEDLWAGEFGVSYIERNESLDSVSFRTSLFSKVLQRTHGVKSVLEFGANIGLNLHALHGLLPSAEMRAVEINEAAFKRMKAEDWIDVKLGSMLDNNIEMQGDFVFTCGVLIHINPDQLLKAYNALYNNSRKYIFISEYFNPSPVSITYRGKEDCLFKRDFAGELLEMYNDLVLVDYGFVYKRDNNFPLDNMNWFLLEKRSR